MRPILEVIRNKLMDGSTVELVVLEELISRMSGIEADQSGSVCHIYGLLFFSNAFRKGWSEKQISALGGSASLRTTMRPIPLESHMSTSTARLRKALDSSGVMAQIAILINQVEMFFCFFFFFAGQT